MSLILSAPLSLHHSTAIVASASFSISGKPSAFMAATLSASALSAAAVSAAALSAAALSATDLTDIDLTATDLAAATLSAATLIAAAFAGAAADWGVASESLPLLKQSLTSAFLLDLA